MKIINRFEATVKKNPNTLAVIDNDREVSFQQLREKALKIGEAVRERLGGMINQPVSIFLSESADYVAAILGVLYSGNFYVPLIKNGAKSLLKTVIESINPQVIITDFESAGALVRCAISISKQLVLEEVYEEVLDEDPIVEEYRKITDKDPVYIMHTSGSTGVPKGVVISHGGLVDYVEWVGKTFQMDATKRIGSKTSFAFDNSVLDIFSMVFYGSLLVLKYPKEKKPDLKKVLFKMLQEIKEHRINLIFWVPLYLKLFADHDIFQEGVPANLKQVLFCGEVMHNKHLNYWRKHLPDTQYANLYGPTEVTDVCSYYIVNRPFSDDEPLPIGKACENMSVLILNDDLKLIEPGESGEIYVRGTGVALGYWQNPFETAKVFVQNPLHNDYSDICYKIGDLGTYNAYGEILFLGRKDTQIKYFGTRIELGEIEVAACAMEGIEDCVVLFDSQEAVMTLVYQASSEIEKLEIMRFLHDKVTAVPTRYVHMKKFPLNNSGKVDRVTLRGLLREKLNGN